MPNAIPGADSPGAELDQTVLRATVLAEAMAGTAAELRLLDPDDLIGYVRRARWAEIADLVQTASELHFVEGSLSFACRAGFASDWRRAPSLSLDLEFAGRSVTAFFTLHLGRDEDGIELRSLYFAVDPADEAAGTGMLAAALAGARLAGCPVGP